MKLKPLVGQASQAAERVLSCHPEIAAATEGSAFSSSNSRKSRFLWQTQPFGMTRCEFFRSYFGLSFFLATHPKPDRLKPVLQLSPQNFTIVLRVRVDWLVTTAGPPLKR